ncbi:relaxin-3 receptor 1 [Callorhinchus milii]|nr:relaxin-3 receptor 1 [Callorhinchus milii]
MGDLSSNSSRGTYNTNLSLMPEEENYRNVADVTLILRIIISIIYSIVCAVGLVGNLMVFFLMKVRQRRKKSTINVFILNLAVTDFQFVLTLPFWAVDTALDFSWPFGDAMCKIILSVTVLNMYASVFFLTAMGIARYWSVATVLKSERPRFFCSVKCISCALWLAASIVTVPTAVFSTVNVIAGEKLCLLKFPAKDFWLALYHLQKIIFAFVLPTIILSIYYLRLLRFLSQRKMHSTNNPKRKSRVTRSITIIMLSFFLCWLPNHVITLWGVLVKLNAVSWGEAYFVVQTYIFPVTVCLAHTNSCLNPVLYCLMRREFREALKEVFWKISAPAVTHTCPTRPRSGTLKPGNPEVQTRRPLDLVDSGSRRTGSVYNEKV